MKAAGAFCFASKPLRRAGGWGSLQPFTLASCRGRATSKRPAPAQRLARVVRPHELRPHLRVMAGPEGKQAGNLPRLSAASDCPFIHRHARLGVRCGWLFCRDQHRPLLSARITPKLPPCGCVTARFAQHITKPPQCKKNQDAAGLASGRPGTQRPGGAQSAQSSYATNPCARTASRSTATQRPRYATTSRRTEATPSSSGQGHSRASARHTTAATSSERKRAAPSAAPSPLKGALCGTNPRNKHGNA